MGLQSYHPSLEGMYIDRVRKVALAGWPSNARTTIYGASGSRFYTA